MTNEAQTPTKPAKRPSKPLSRFISRHQAAADCGVSRQAIIKVIRLGAFKVTADNQIDTLDPDYLYYREKARARKGTPGPSAQELNTKPSKPANRQSKRVSKPSAASRQIFFGTKQDADIAKIREQITALQLKNEQQRATLIPREIAKRVFGEIHSVESTELLSLGDRISPEIAGMAGVEKPEIILAIGQLIRNEVGKAIDHVYTIVERFINNIPTDEAEAISGNDDSIG